MEKIKEIVRLTYDIHGFSGSARIDFQLDAAGDIYVLEANPNPQIVKGEYFADSAERAGLPYALLLQRILDLGLRRSPLVTTSGRTTEAPARLGE